MRTRVIEHGVVDSTNERALVAIADGTARHGDVHVARGQTAGRGRRGASWASAEGEGLYATLVVAPDAPAPHPAALTMAAGLAVLETVRALRIQGARLKWPNDVIAGGAKLAGILVESRGLDPGAPRYALGVGIDCLQRSFPPGVPGTSMALLGRPTDPAAVLAELTPRLVRHVEQALADAERTAGAYAGALGLVGARVRVDAGGRTHEGRLVGLSIADGLALTDSDVLPLAHVRAVERVDPGG